MNTRQRRLTVPAAGLVLVLSISMGAWAMAQHQGHGRGPGGGGADHGMVLRHVLGQLDLSEDQKMAVHEGMSSHHQEMESLLEDLREAKQAVGQAIHAPQFDEIAIRDAAALAGQMEADLAVGRAELLHELRAILTAEQQESLETILGTIMAEHEAHGMGHRSMHSPHGEDGGKERTPR